MPTNDCPCETVKQLEKNHDKLCEIVEKHSQQLMNGSVAFATINAKLSVVMGVMSAIGIAVLGFVIKQFWG